MNLTRRNLARGAAAGLVAAGLPLRHGRAAAKYTLRYGTAFPATHPGAKRIVEAAATISKETNGAVDLQVYPNGQFGSEPSMFNQTRSGAIDFMSTSGANQTVVPGAGINTVAFAFPSYKEVWAAMDGGLGDAVRAAFGKVGLFVMPKMLDNGYRNVTTSTKPINAPADLKGFKIRVPDNRLFVSIFQDLGAAPTPIDFSQLYSALQTKVVDGQENPLALIESAKLYEVQKYVSMTGHMWDGHYIFANAKRWASMPADVQKIIIAALSTAAEREREDLVKMNDSAEAMMKQHGLVFNDVNKMPFRDTLRQAGYYTYWKGQFGEPYWGLLEKYAGKL